MDYSSKISAFLLVFILSISSSTALLENDCGSCSKPEPTPPPAEPPSGEPTIPLPKLPIPPVTVPELPIPPVVPKLPIPPVAVPPVVPKLPIPPVSVPKLPLPPVAVVPKLPIPPVTVPPVTVPPVVNPPKGKKGCAPRPAGKKTCPIDTLKLGACVNLLGGLMPIKVGDPAVNKCCPLLKGLVEAEAAACLCTTLKIKALNLKIYVPLAIQLLVYCGKTPPPGFTCSL